MVFASINLNHQLSADKYFSTIYTILSREIRKLGCDKPEI